jgi:hypothetical protein
MSWFSYSLHSSASSPDVKRTVRGLFGEKSCIQDIGMLLMDFTNRASTAISATISLEVPPFNAARDRVTPARLGSGLESIRALVASTSIRPFQSMPASASGTFTQCVARIIISHSADCCLVPALAPGPSSATNPPSVSGLWSWIRLRYDPYLSNGGRLCALRFRRL